jgi:hypothetical protein
MPRRAWPDSTTTALLPCAFIFLMSRSVMSSA